jgi:prepilin-type N-terminal cleavage/methylation domain-containing protein
MVGRRAPEQGMTLVELMVTMVIASIVAASTFMFFAGQQRVYETQTKMLNVQQNAWAAMEVLTRFIRAEGSGMYGCVRPVGGLTPPPPPLNRTTGANPDLSDDPPVVSGVSNLSQRPNAGLRANNAGAMQRIPPLWIVDQEDGTDVGIVPGTDVITVAFGNKTSGTNYDSVLGGVVTATNVSIPLPLGNAAMFQPAEFIILVGDPGMGGPSDIGCTFFQITSITTNPDQLNHVSGGTTACPQGAACAGSVWNPPGTVAAMIPGTGYTTPALGATATGVRNFGQFWWVRFAVRTTNANGVYLSNRGIPGVTHDIPVLTMERLDLDASTPIGPQVLAEGIEDLQVAFACDLNGDGALTEDSPPSTTDEWTLNAAGDPIEVSNARKCNQPSAVRVTLIARSLTEDNGIDANLLDNGRPAAENHVAHTPDNNFNTGRDQFRRRVLSTTMYPRN